MPLETVVSNPFATVPDRVRPAVQLSPSHPAPIRNDRVLGYGALDQMMDQAGASPQRGGLQAGSAIAASVASSIEYVAEVSAAGLQSDRQSAEAGTA